MPAPSVLVSIAARIVLGALVGLFLLWFLSLVGLSLLAGFSALRADHADRHIARSNGFAAGTCSQLASTYFSQPSTAWQSAFTANDLPRQYEIYLCGNQYMEPPAMLDEPFAAEGAPAAAFLRAKLAATKEDATVREIFEVFAQMQRLRTYEVTADQLLMVLLRQKAQAVSNRSWHEYLARALFLRTRPCRRRIGRSR